MCGCVVFFVERRVAAHSCVTGWDFQSGHAGTGKGLEVVGDVHPIFSCNSFATDFRSSVVSSWNDRGGHIDTGIGRDRVPDQLYEDFLEGGEPYRVPFGLLFRASRL